MYIQFQRAAFDPSLKRHIARGEVLEMAGDRAQRYVKSGMAIPHAGPRRANAKPAPQATREAAPALKVEATEAQPEPAPKASSRKSKRLKKHKKEAS